MADSPSLFPKLTKGYTIPNVALSPTRTFSLSTKPATILDSNIPTGLGGISPSILLSEESPIFNHNPPVWPANIAIRQDSRSFGPRMTLDERTIACIEQLVEDRQLSYRSPRAKDKAVLYQEGSVDWTNQKIIEKVETFIKVKGLESGTKDKQFENNLEIFDQVKTYVDTRKLFTEPEEVRESPKNQMKRLQTQEFALSVRIVEPKTTRESFFGSSGSPKSFKLLTGTDSPVHFKKQSIFGSRTARNPIDDLSVNTDIVNEGVTDEDKKRLEIRALYQQLKEDAIQRFGPELFENAKKRLRNPASRKMLEVKRDEEIDNMRKLREELGDLDIGRKLMDNLMQKSPISNNIQEGTLNNFDNYVKNELKEDKPKQDKIKQQGRKSFSHPVEFNDYGYGNRPAELDILGDMSSRVTQTEEDPQIQLLWKVQQHKQKSEEILKALRSKIMSVQKKEKNNLLSSPRSSRGLISPRKSKYSKGILSADFRNKMRGDLLIPPIMLDSPKEIGKRHSSRVTLEKNSSTPQLRIELERIQTEDDLDLLYKRDKVKSPDLVKKNGKKMTVNAKGLHQAFPTKKKNNSISTLAVHKDKLLGICSDLDNLATRSKDLNKQVEASIKEMSNSYAMKSNIMKNQGIPESLRMPIPDSHIKSNSKLANTLAAKIYRTADNE